MRLPLILALLAGCGDSGPDCGFESGTYTVTYLTLNGDCPDRPLRLVTPSAVSPECVQTIEYGSPGDSGDECSVNLVRECERDGVYGRYVLTLEPRGTGYTGLYQVTGPVSDTASCSGLYAVTYTAQ